MLDSIIVVTRCMTILAMIRLVVGQSGFTVTQAEHMEELKALDLEQEASLFIVDREDCGLSFCPGWFVALTGSRPVLVLVDAVQARDQELHPYRKVFYLVKPFTSSELGSALSRMCNEALSTEEK